MNASDLVALLPMIVLSAAAVIVMLAAAFWRNHLLAAVLAVVGLAGAFGTTWLAATVAPRQVTPLVVIDGYAVFFIGLITAAALAVAFLAYDYWKARTSRPEEFYLLLLLATLGAAVLASSSHFASFFLGLEILSVSLYALIAYQRGSFSGTEAAIKYLVLAATSAAFLLFGMALVYAETGTLAFARFGEAYTAGQTPGLLVLTGLVLMLVGIGFKLAVVPFHLWTPDVYQGAPAPVTAFIATVSKGAMFAVFLRFFRDLALDAGNPVFLVLAIVSFASMFLGNLLGLLQNNVKRILAYSSIAHLGYLLVAFLASGSLAATAVAFYLTTYFVTTLGAFGVVIVLSNTPRDADSLQDYQGLFWQRPWLAAVLSAMLLSLAGIPLTAGFVGKFYLLTAGVASNLWWLVVSLVVSSVIGLFYYLRVLIAMYVPFQSIRGGAAETPLVEVAHPRPSWIGSTVLLALTLLLIWLGLYPAPLLRVIENAM